MTTKSENTVIPSLSPWTIKERIYVLNSTSTPVSFQLRSRHSRFRSLTWFDEEQQRARPLRYASDQLSFFQDEQFEPVMLTAVLFEDGKLIVPKENVLLQQFLAIHPDNAANGGGIFKEYDAEANAKKELDSMKVRYDAFQVIYESDPETLESLGRLFFPSKVDKMSLSEIKFDLIREADKDPERMVEASKDPNLKITNLAARALREGIVKFKPDNSTLVYGANGKKIHTFLPTSDHLSALSKYLITDDGLELSNHLQTKLT